MHSKELNIFRTDEHKQNSEPTTLALTPTKRLTIDVPGNLHKALKLKAVGDGVTMAELVRQMLMEQLKLLP